MIAKAIVSFSYVFLFTLQGLSSVTVDTTRVRVDSSDHKEVRDEITSAIEAGTYDHSGIEWRTLRRGKTDQALLNAAMFKSLDTKQKNLVLDGLVAYRSLILENTYRVTVNADTEDLASQSILHRLEIDIDNLEGKIEAEELLSPYAHEWAYKLSNFNGPNCWHTSMASIFPGWEEHRYMTPEEFSCHVKNSFTQLHPESLSELEYGDLIRLTDDNGEVHGFTFLGPDRKKPDRFIVFTKNGWNRSRYLFMDLDTVWQEVYPNTDISYYRPHRTPIDPASGEETECSEYQKRFNAMGYEIDPLIMAGYRKDRGRSLKVLEFK